MLPVQAEIHRRVLSFFRNLINDNNSLEWEICLRQVALKLKLVYVQSILDKYNLPSASELLLDTPSCNAWKASVSLAMMSFWENQYVSDAMDKSSLQYVSDSSLDPREPAVVWSSSSDSLHETKKATIKVRFMTDTYKLQSHEAQYTLRNQHPMDPTCLLCGSGPETTLHCLMYCPQFLAIRDTYILKLKSVLLSCVIDPEPLCDASTLLQITLDCKHNTLPVCVTHNMKLVLQIEEISRAFIYKIHIRRGILLAEVAPPCYKLPKARDRPTKRTSEIKSIEYIHLQ